MVRCTLVIRKSAKQSVPPTGHYIEGGDGIAAQIIF